MQVVTGTRPHASASVKLWRSMPPEKESWKRPAVASANRVAAWMASTWSGGPERYICFWSGKKVLWFSTTSVFVNFAPTERPRAAATPERRPIIATT